LSDLAHVGFGVGAAVLIPAGIDQRAGVQAQRGVVDP
jgi:hypothetical protein